MRRLAATLVALATLSVPAVAGAQVGYDGCAGGGCTSSADEIRCWWPQGPAFVPSPLFPQLSRQRASGQWELAVGTDTFHQGSQCVEVLDDVWVYEGDVVGVQAFLKERALASGLVVELEGELVPNSLAMGWLLCIHSFEASGWHNHRDGGLQIIPSTWRSYGGLEYAPVAGEAPIEQQITVALRVLDAAGATQWSTWRRCA